MLFLSAHCYSQSPLISILKIFDMLALASKSVGIQNPNVETAKSTQMKNVISDMPAQVHGGKMAVKTHAKLVMDGIAHII